MGSGHSQPKRYVYIDIGYYANVETINLGNISQGADPPPLPLGINHLNQVNTTLLPTGIGERNSQTMSKCTLHV